MFAGLFVALVGARIAAELAERARQPAVLAEIAAGIILGPSVLGLVHVDVTLHTFGELGAILLLFEAGMHMSLGDLRRAGGNSLAVAGVGMVVPMALGYGAMIAFGASTRSALFLAAGLTATSVGITARVFTDLRRLTSIEAHTVMGAAVADDVGGLLVLAVVQRIAAGSLPSAKELIVLPVIAIGFVLFASVAGSTIARKGLAPLLRTTRTDAAATTVGFALAIGVAGLAAGVQLAPIVGAFVAGVALSDSSARADVQRRLSPLGHVFIPLFFVSIGAEADVRRFADPWVLGVGAVITVLAVAGKVVAGFVIRPGTADRLTIGIGMIPRGEVGLIFASLGLASGALGGREHAVLLLVVFTTTLIAPPWLRHRAARSRVRAGGSVSLLEPQGGWLRTTPDEVSLAATPPDVLLPRVALDAALLAARRRPDDALLQWLARAPEEPVVWDDALRDRFIALLRDGTPRGWRLLHTTGALHALLPELDDVVRRRSSDPFDIDPAAPVRWNELDALRGAIAKDEWAADAWDDAGHHDVVLLVALAVSAFERTDDTARANSMAMRMRLDPGTRDLLRSLWDERRLIPAAAARWDAVDEDRVMELAAHLGSRERAAASFLLAYASATDDTARGTLRELHALVRSALTHPELASPGVEDLLARRRSAAAAALTHPALAAHLDAAPRRYVLATDPREIALHLEMVETPLATSEVRLRTSPGTQPGTERLHVAMQDRRGALADLANALSRGGVEVLDAVVSSWRSGLAIDVFTVRAPASTDWVRLARWVERGDATTLEPIEGSVDIDNDASPWHSIVEVRAADRRGLLAKVAAAFARTGIAVQSATVQTVDGIAVDRFLVTGPHGHKLDERTGSALRDALAGRDTSRRRLRRSENILVT